MIKPQLAIFLNLGDSFKRYRQSGRDIHWQNNYLKYYPKTFNRPLVFSYAREANPFSDLIKLLPNRFQLPRFIYTFLIPLIYYQAIKSCHVLRVKQMLGVWPALLAKLFFKQPIIATYGYDYTYFARKDGRFFILPFIKLTEYLGLKFSDKIIVTNQAMAAKIKSITAPKKVILIPNGVDIKLFQPRPQSHSAFIHLVTIGRLVYQKNLLNLIKAVAQQNSRRPIVLSILGRGELKPQLLNTAKQLRVKLKIIDSLPHDKIPQFINSADLFVLASHHEGSPKALLEAMACGLPCLVADKDYSRFIITSRHNGWLCADSAAGLSQAIKILLAKPKLRQRLGLEARKRIVADFNQQKIIMQEINLLKSLIP